MLFILIYLKRIKNLTRPTPFWGPALVKHRELVTYVEGFVVDPFKQLYTISHSFTGSPVSTSV